MAVQKSGFVIDAVSAYIQTSNGSDYQVVTAQSGDVKLSGSSVEINGGWGLYALANIPSGMGLDIALSDSKFNLDAMALSSGGNVTENVSTTEYMFGVPYTVEATGHTIVLDYVAVASSIKIPGLTETTGTTPTATQFVPTINTPSGKTTILFNTAMDGKTIYPKGEKASTGAIQLSVLANSIPKTGLCVVRFPIYSDASVDASIACYGQFTIFKCQILPDFTAGGSRKSANAFGLNLKGLNPNRSDNKIFDFHIMS